MEGISGVVKSFGLSSGYGFIESDAVQGDIFFSKRALPSDLADAINGKCFDLAGREIVFNADNKDGKAQAHGIQLVPQEGQPLVGKVKSFNPTKGYGFIGAEALMGQDIFFMRTELPRECQQSQSLSGTPVSFSIVQTPEGRIHAQGVRVGNTGNTGKGGGNLGFDASIFSGMDPTQLGLAIMNGQIPLPFGGGKGGKGGKGATKAGGGALASSGQTLSGTVKTFNPMKGWGFLTSPSHPHRDIYFKSGDGTVAQGMRVSFEATVRPDGQVQAMNVTVGHGGQKRGFDGIGFNQPSKRPKFNPPGSTSGHAVSGTIKSYHAGNRWGFIDCNGVDVYFKGNSLPVGQQHRSDLVGAYVTFEAKETPDGKLQAMPGIVISGQS